MAESAVAAVDEGSGALFTELKSVYVNLRVMGAIPEGDGWKDSVSLSACGQKPLLIFQTSFLPVDKQRTTGTV